MKEVWVQTCRYRERRRVMNMISKVAKTVLFFAAVSLATLGALADTETVGG